jgi:predicted oxidoreductase
VKPCEAIPKCRIKHYNTSREYILQQVNRSLGMLGVDHIDLLLLHRQDMLMDADEVIKYHKIMQISVMNKVKLTFTKCKGRRSFQAIA